MHSGEANHAFEKVDGRLGCWLLDFEEEIARPENVWNQFQDGKHLREVGELTLANMPCDVEAKNLRTVFKDVVVLLIYAVALSAGISARLDHLISEQLLDDLEQRGRFFLVPENIFLALLFKKSLFPFSLVLDLVYDFLKVHHHDKRVKRVAPHDVDLVLALSANFLDFKVKMKRLVDQALALLCLLLGSLDQVALDGIFVVTVQLNEQQLQALNAVFGLV